MSAAMATATQAASDVAFGAEISENRRFAAIVAAGRSAAEPAKVVAELAWYDHPRGAVAELERLYLTRWPVAVVMDPRSQSATMLGPLAEAGIAVSLPSAQDVAVAHGAFMDLVSDGLLVHLGQEPLTAAVRAAQQRPLAGAQAWERRILADQAPLVAATLACWALARWEEASMPGVWAV